MNPVDHEPKLPVLYARTLNNTEKRSLVLHLLYTMDIHDYLHSLNAIVYQYERAFACVIEPEDDIFRNTEAIIAYQDTADELIKPLLKHWKFERVSLITKLILRYAIWEIMNKISDPALAINEAIELAKGFGENDSYRFIHGILDTIVKQNSSEIIS